VVVDRAGLIGSWRPGRLRFGDRHDTEHGPIDRVARVVVAFAVALLSLSLGFGTVIGIVLLVVAGILLVTATVGFCPLYALFHISTRSRRHASL
jgi:Protein of unknown function (DUF2892)